MKKKAILGFMTGAAIVAATTGSYAAWDQLKVNPQSKTVTISKPFQLTAAANSITAVETSRTLGSDTEPTVVATLPVTVDTAGHTNLILNAADVSAVLDSTSIPEGQISTEIFKGDVPVTEATVIDDGNYSVKVTVTLTDADAEKITDGNLDISVGANLAEKKSE